MTRQWMGDRDQVLPPMTFIGALRALIRFFPMAIITFGGLGLLLLVRLIERPIFGMDRPITPYITQAVCRADLWVLGIRLSVRGRPMQGGGAMVANHGSWLDIFTLNALDHIYFVAKHEVETWFGIGWLARATGTVFVERKASAAKRQKEMFLERLNHDHRLLFFPEGTSTDGRRVLEFKTTLFAAFFEIANKDDLAIQPITVIYTAPKGYDPDFYGWWGNTDFGPHLLALLAAKRGGHAQVIFHAEEPVAKYPGRKEMAAALEGIVRAGMDSVG